MELVPEIIESGQLASPPWEVLQNPGLSYLFKPTIGTGGSSARLVIPTSPNGNLNM